MEERLAIHRVKMTKPCRICRHESLRKFLSLGPTPLANRFLTEEQLGSPEPVYPLDVYLCESCGLVQLRDVVPAELLFKNYVYVSSTSETLPKHFRSLADEVADNFALSADSLVVEVGSNDGCLLKAFRTHGCRTVGVEPATNIAKVAQSSGIETVNEFFNEKTARTIAKQWGKAAAIVGTNVLGHIDNLHDFLCGVAILLQDAGVLICEIPYLVDLFIQREFDTIYHEHLSYFSLRPLGELFRSHDLELFDVKQVAVHGGSIRVYVRRPRPGSTSTQKVSRLLALEKELHLDAYETYVDFAHEVQSTRETLVNLLKRLKSEGKRLVGYGAPAKGNTLLNYCQIGTETLDYLVDKSSYKQGLYSPGMHIPVFPVERILEDQPDYVLLLAWNFAEEILKQQHAYRERGGKFILPIPEVKIV